MTVQLIPYLTFGSTCREAMEFYASVLGGTPQFSTFGESVPDMAGDDRIMHADLTTDAGLHLMASDNPMGETPSGDNVTLSIVGDDAVAIRRWFDGLSEGGEVTMPLEKQMWGDEYGQLTDRYGMSWSFNATGGDSQDAPAV